jgi:hypothetical protein
MGVKARFELAAMNAIQIALNASRIAGYLEVPSQRSVSAGG